MAEQSNFIANSRGVHEYMSGIQYSRLFALTFLDENFRNAEKYSAEEVKDYVDFMARALSEYKEMSRESKVAKLHELIGGKNEMDAVVAAIPYSEFYFDRFYENAKHLVPTQSFRIAMEENPLWAATNSVFYIMSIHRFEQKFETRLFNNNIFENNQSSQSMVRTMLSNLLFENILLTDQIPSCIDGYTFNTVVDIAKKTSKAITLPSNATTC